MIGRRSLLIVISTIVASILSFVGLLAMTNYLGKDAYGNIAWVLATIGTLNVVSDLGFNSAHIKRVSEGQDESSFSSPYSSGTTSPTRPFQRKPGTWSFCSCCITSCTTFPP